jgi:hypothetical protein
VVDPLTEMTPVLVRKAAFEALKPLREIHGCSLARSSISGRAAPSSDDLS